MPWLMLLSGIANGVAVGDVARSPEGACTEIRGIISFNASGITIAQLELLTRQVDRSVDR